MIIGQRLQLEVWNKKWNRNWSWSDWTRLKCDDLELCNSIEFTEWDREPVCPIICEECGTGFCGPAGMAQLVRTESQLLWMQPYDLDRYDTLEELREHSIADTVMINRAEWDEVTSRASRLPKFEAIRRINTHDLWQLWRQQLPAWVHPQRGETQSRHFYVNCIASHPLDLHAAIPLVLPLLSHDSESLIPLTGEFVEVDSDNDNVQTFYFDDAEFAEWRAFMSEPPHQPVIGNRWILRG